MARIGREKRTIDAMVHIYCHAHHSMQDALCNDCRALLDYAHGRLTHCPFQHSKPACNKCSVHCYSSSMRQRVKEVMRFAGPRMLFRHPVLAWHHLIDLIGKPPSLARKQHSDRDR